MCSSSVPILLAKSHMEGYFYFLIGAVPLYITHQALLCPAEPHKPQDPVLRAALLLAQTSNIRKPWNPPCSSSKSAQFAIPPCSLHQFVWMHFLQFTPTCIVLKIQAQGKKKKIFFFLKKSLIWPYWSLCKVFKDSASQCSIAKHALKTSKAVLKHKENIFSSRCHHHICPFNRLPETGDWHSPGSKFWSHMRLSHCHIAARCVSLVTP